MTIVVGMTDGKIVTMGGDACSAGSDFSGHAYKNSKVFRKGDFLVGFTTSWRMGQIIEHAFTPPEHADGKDVMAYMVGDFVPALIAALDAGRWTKPNEKPEFGFCLVGYRGRLFRIEDEFHVMESTKAYAAVGCGAHFAIGAVHHALECDWATPGTNQETFVLAGLRAAASHSVGCTGPFNVLQMTA